MYIFKKSKKNRHLKLEIALAIPASNDEKYYSNNSAGQGLIQPVVAQFWDSRKHWVIMASNL